MTVWHVDSEAKREDWQPCDRQTVVYSRTPATQSQSQDADSTHLPSTADLPPTHRPTAQCVSVTRLNITLNILLSYVCSMVRVRCNARQEDVMSNSEGISL